MKAFVVDRYGGRDVVRAGEMPEPEVRNDDVAEPISVNEGDLALEPRSRTMEDAASVPLVALTAWQALVERANLAKGSGSSRPHHST